jgi:hypothetical protein
MTREMSISHQLHPARREGQLFYNIKYCLAANKKLAIGTLNVDALYSQVKMLYPEAKLTKCEGYLLVESK